MKFLTEEFNRVDMDLKVKDSFCTMLNYKDKLKIKHERYGYKFPKLEEVMNYLRVGELLPHLAKLEVGASLFYPICNNQSCQIVYSMVGHTNHLWPHYPEGFVGFLFIYW